METALTPQLLSRKQARGSRKDILMEGWAGH